MTRAQVNAFEKRGRVGANQRFQASTPYPESSTFSLRNAKLTTLNVSVLLNLTDSFDQSPLGGRAPA